MSNIERTPAERVTLWPCDECGDLIGRCDHKRADRTAVEYVRADTRQGTVASIDLLRGTLAVAAKALDSAGDPDTAERVRAALLATSGGQ